MTTHANLDNAVPTNFVPFELHPNTLRMIIQEQSGTWAKAIAELVMNSVDANATEIHINYSLNDECSRVLKIQVSDNGKGFHNEDQLNFFKVFGAPHESNDAFYGKYRIGRGQCLTFGRVKWRSHNYEMSVDLGDPSEQETALDKIGYDLKEFEEVHQGCMVEVEFFQPIRIWRMKKYNDEQNIKMAFSSLIDLIKFVPVPIFINGVRITYDYSKIKWTYEDENAYYLIQTLSDNKFKDLNATLNEVSIYNRGVFVAEFPTLWKGCCGVVISKNQIKMNMARNAIVENDYYWYELKNRIEILASSAFVGTLTAPKNDQERAVIINQIFFDDGFVVLNSLHQIEHFLKVPLFKMQNGKLFSVIDLIKWAKLYTVCEDEIYAQRTTICEAIEKQKITVIDRNFMGDLDVIDYDFDRDFILSVQYVFTEFIRNISGINAKHNPNEVLNYIESKFGESYVEDHEITVDFIVDAGRKVLSRLASLLQYQRWGVDFVDFDGLANGLNLTYKELSEKDLTEEELACFKAIRRVNAKFKEHDYGDRKLKLGQSDHALAWTDSFSTIWITKRVLHMMRDNDFSKIVLILLHEYCHCDASVNSHATHKHNLEFYERFEELSISIPLDSFCDLLRSRYVRWLAESNSRPSSALAYSLDRTFEYYPDLIRKNTDSMRMKFQIMGYKLIQFSERDITADIK